MVIFSAVSADSGRTVCTEPLPKVCAPMMVARLWSCKAPATISLAEAEPSLTSTTSGTVFIAAGSLRKGSPPDLDGADRHYREALRIAPAHRGALEYSGELALMKGDLPQAEQRLAALDKACTFGCEEYTDLKQAVQRYKAAGNRYQPAP